MVARINTSKNLRRVLNYNEQKVASGTAQLLAANNFLKEVSELSFYEKERTFKMYMELNTKTTTNTLHVSLNFDPSEKLSNDKLEMIAKAYMTKIGFGDQPYLLYRHFDAAHPHVHIVATNIQNDGRRISLHNLGKNFSEKARKEIEVEFDLVKAQGKTQSEVDKLTPIRAQKIIAGKQTVKGAISNILSVVLSQYKFTSLPELNAVLGLYNVRAERCDETSETFKHGGLYYRVLDERGNAIGAPVKASLFHMKPTLKNLERIFEQNKLQKQLHAAHCRTVIDLALLTQKKPLLESLIKTLEKEGINTVIRKNGEGFIYGITYVDHKTKTVFNGSELGKAYSAKMILERCQVQLTGSPKLNQRVEDEPRVKIKKTELHSASNSYQDSLQNNAHESLTTGLLKSDNSEQYLPQAFKKRKKKRKGQSPN